MQSTSKEIYKMTAQRTGKKEQLYEDVGKFIFREIRNALDYPKSLITKVKGLGYWYLRKQRMLRIMVMLEPYYEGVAKLESDFDSKEEFITYSNKKKFYDNFKERLVEYEEYISLKKRINELKVLHKAAKRKDKGEEPSQTDS